MTSYDRYILGVTLFLMLAMSSADIDCKMKSGCSTQCDPIGWNNIEEHLFNKKFSITCRNNEDDKLREEIEELKTENRIVKNLLLTVQDFYNKEIDDLKTNQKKLQQKISEMEVENRDLKDSSTRIQKKYDKENGDLKTNHRNLQNKVSEMEIENKDLKESSAKMQKKYDKEIGDMKTNHKDLMKKISEMDIQYRDLKNPSTKIQGKNDINNNNTTTPDLNKELDVITATGCHEVKPKNVKKKSGTGGVFDISYLTSQTEVFCDLKTDGGGWTVFQRRFDGSQDFNQHWKNYAEGFGKLTGEFWLGLEKMHVLTQTGQYELRIEMTDEHGGVGIAKYQTFSISGSSDNYRLNIGGFSGTGVSDKMNYNINMEFTTRDRDNDKWSDGNCSNDNRGNGWWHRSCSFARLNGRYGHIYWYGFSYNIRKTEMKFRKK